MQSQVQYTQPPPQSSQPMGMREQQQPIGDVINQLPTDDTILSHNEIRIVDQLFHEKKGIFDNILSKTKDFVMLGLLFVVFSLPFVDELIKKFVTITGTSTYILLGVKALLFVFAYFTINNLYLVKKQ
jgi:hypothetical protein